VKLLYEGKAKRVYELDNDILVMEFKDEVTAGDGAWRDEAPGKGEMAAKTSAKLFQYLQANGVNTHLVRYEAPNRLVVKRLEMIPLEVIVRFYAYGSILKRMPKLSKLQRLDPPIVEFHYKSDELHDPLILAEDAVATGIVSMREVEGIKAMALRAAELLRDVFERKGATLVDIKFEFGRLGGGLVLGDEISGDTMRVLLNGEHLDKEYYRATRDVKGLLNRYRTLLQMLEDL